MSDDFSEVINRFSEILKEKNIDLNNITSGNTQTSNNSTNTETNDFSLDVETILKIKNIISLLNQNQNSPRNNLLHSLKPYLENKKQEKLEQYIKIANLLSVMENLDLGIQFLENKKGYDFILIITLFLLII